MYILKNALKNLKRNKGRNILMALITLAIVTTSAVALIISNTSSNIIESYKDKFGSEVFISANAQTSISRRQDGTYDVDSPQITPITPEQYLSFADSELLKEYTLTVSASGKSDTLKAIGEDEQNDMFQGNSNNTGGGPSFSVGGGGGMFSITDMPNFNLTGNDNIAGMEDFADGTRQIIEGDFYQNLNECIISRELAELNGISLNDTIELTVFAGMGIRIGTGTSDDDDEEEEEARVLTLKVVGIYEDFTEDSSDSMPFRLASMISGNEILTSFDTLYNEEAGTTGINVSAKYILKSPDDLDAFTEELYAKGLNSEEYNVYTDDTSYNSTVKPVENMRTLTITFLIVVLILGSIILILLSAIAMRERKYEIGVLRAMGMKKGKVTLGLFSETIILTTACLLIGLSIGAVSAQPVSDMLLKQVLADQTSQQEDSMPQQGQRGGNMQFSAARSINGRGFMQSSVDTIDELTVSLSAATMGQLALIALLLAGVASVIGITFVTRYEPMRILSDRT